MTAWFSRWVRESPPASFWSFSCPNTSWHTWQSEQQTQVTHAEVTAPSGVPFNTFTELTFFPCLPSCSRTPLQSRPCRLSDARWSHSWSAEGERSTETLTQTQEKHGLPLRDRKLWVDVPVFGSGCSCIPPSEKADVCFQQTQDSAALLVCFTGGKLLKNHTVLYKLIKSIR